jgi:DNA polymerase I-like protein with 3'-5' exonuclease and polymerase domains
MMNWFWKLLLGAGIQKADARIVYMLDEPPHGSSGPLKAQLRASRDRFVAEVQASTPLVVIPMGPMCLEAVTGIRSSRSDKTLIEDTRGFLIRKDLFEDTIEEVWEKVGEYKRASKVTDAKPGDPKMKWVKRTRPCLLSPFSGVVIATFDLEFVRIGQFAVKPALKEDLCRSRRAVTGALVELDRDLEYYETRWSQRAPGFIFPLEVTEDLFEHVWGEVISVDIETHGIDNEVIDLVSLSDGKATASLEWNQETRDFIGRIFALPKRIYAIHNSPFDIPRLMLNGVPIAQKVLDEQVFDTMFGSVVLQPDLHKGLGRIASVYLDLTPWKWRKLSETNPRFYSAKDALVTYWLAIQEINAMKQLGCWELYMGQGGHPGPGVMATIPELTLMSEGGLRLNRARALELGGRLQRKLLRLLKLWSQHFPDVNPLSNPKLQKLLYSEWGLPVERTKKDGITVSELSLMRLQAFIVTQKGNAHFNQPWQDDARAVPRIFDLLLAIRDTNKLYGTYVTPAMANEEAFIHPQYMPVSKDDDRGGKKMDNKGNTSTGRLASYRPNIQNQPKKMRDLYVPDRDDMCFVQADFKSAELYVLAGMSGDARLLNDLQGDMHQKNADRFGIIRKVAKNVVYASQYLASPSKQSEMIYAQSHLYVSPAECQRISEQMWGHYADATAYKNYIISLCNTQKFVKNPFGRIRFFHDGSAPAAVDFIPQSTVADILWCVLKPVAALARALGGRMVTTVHDSILVCVPEAAVGEVSAKMKSIMQRHFDCVRPGFYIPVEIEVAPAGAPWSKVAPYVRVAA